MKSSNNTSTFVYTNPHPNGARYISDCAYRAISIATGKDWLTIYDELTELGRRLLSPPNDDHTINVYLDEIGDRIRVKSVGSKPNGRNVAALDPTKTYVVKVVGHLFAVKDGKIRDTWNSGNCAIKTVWMIKC